MDVSTTESSIQNQPQQHEQQQVRKPKFILKSLEPAEGKQDEFVICSTGQQDFRVTRTFHDFQFLEQQLFHSGQCLYGYILPPFPQQLAANSGDGCTIPGYGRFVRDELQLFHWLRLVLEHPIFGHSGLVEPFLTEINLPPPGKIVKQLGIIKSIQDTIDSRKYAHKDCDLFFQNERDWSIKVFDYMQIALEAFHCTINARHSLSQVLAHLSAALSVPIGDNSGLNKVSLDTNLAFSSVLDGYREYVEAETISGATTLGAPLLLWTRFVEAEKEMLKQRTCLLVDYESANRNFDRARYQQRKPEVEEAKWNAERAFEKCSEVARGEIKRFQSNRISDLTQALNNYKASQLALARDHYQKLSDLYRQVVDDLTPISDLPA